MSRSNGYSTKQKVYILEYLKTLNGEHVTVNDIYKHLCDNKISIGVTTIYRYLDRLFADGIVKKYKIDGVEGSCYEYIGEDRSCKKHYHLKCDSCGKLIHFECEEMSKLQSHILDDHGFNVDSLKTTFHGKCRDCSKK